MGIIIRASLVAVVLAAVLLTVSCASGPQTPSTQTAGQNKQQTSKQPPKPYLVSVDIVFDMGQAAGPGLDVYKGDFKPQELYVSGETIVTWENKEDFLLGNHSVTSKNGLFDKELKMGESFNYTFTKPGTYEYYCKTYPIMTGKIIVE